jgi:hypothetical protein
VRDAAANETFGNQADPQFLSTNPSVTATGFGFVFIGTNGATPPTAMMWTKACRHLSQASAQTRCSPARKLRAVFS